MAPTASREMIFLGVYCYKSNGLQEDVSSDDMKFTKVSRIVSDFRYRFCVKNHWNPQNTDEALRLANLFLDQNFSDDASSHYNLFSMDGASVWSRTTEKSFWWTVKDNGIPEYRYSEMDKAEERFSWRRFLTFRLVSGDGYYVLY